MRTRRPSSQLLEFLLATAVGFLAVLGALLCVGFLLVDPVRNPSGVGETQPLPDYEGTLSMFTVIIIINPIEWGICSVYNGRMHVHATYKVKTSILCREQSAVHIVYN